MPKFVISYNSLNRMTLSQSDSRITIFMRLNNGNGCSLQVRRSQTLDQLVQILNYGQIDLPESYCLVYKGTPFTDFTKSLAQASISNNSILHIEEVTKEATRPLKMDVCIFLKGEKFIIKSQSNETVSDLKVSIYNLLKIRPKEQLLVFKGCILDNSLSLAHYRIKQDSLVVLHTNSAIPKDDDVDSDYDQVGEGAILFKNNSLLDSVISLCQKKGELSKTTLFRSDSMGKRNIVEPLPYQIEIHQRNTNDDNESEDERDFNFDLFKSFGMANPMTLSIGYNLFDSFKHPVDRFDLKNIELKSKKLMAQNAPDDDSLVESISSFGNQ